MHAVWMPPLSQTWMCVTATCPFSRGVRPTACMFLPSWWGGRAGELCAGILVQRNVFLHTQWSVMGTVRTTCNCSLERALSLIMATCRSVEMVRLLWKYSTSEGFFFSSPPLLAYAAGQTPLRRRHLFAFAWLQKYQSIEQILRGGTCAGFLCSRKRGKCKWWNSVVANNNLHLFDWTRGAVIKKQ